MHSELEKILRAGKRIANGGAEPFTQFDAPGADREQAGPPRLRSIQVLRDAEQFRSAEVMRDQPWFQRSRAELTQHDLAGSLIQRTVHKNHRLGCGDLFRHIRRPLVIAEYAHPSIIAPVFFCPLCKKRPDAIILAHRVATGEDEASN